MQRSPITFIVLLALAITSFAADQAFARGRMYHLGMGRFMQRDPLGTELDPTANNPLQSAQSRILSDRQFTQRGPIAQYTDDMSLYSYVRNNPVNRLDPSGLKWVKTGITVCDGYIKGSWVWGLVSAHTYLTVDGVGYGFYSKAHVQGGGSSSDVKAVWDSSVIQTNDHLGYPQIDPFKVTSGNPYATCQDYEVDDCHCDAAKIKATLKGDIQKQLSAQANNNGQTYQVWARNCSQWVTERLISATLANCDRSDSIVGRYVPRAP